jgi:hypothetical protein
VLVLTRFKEKNNRNKKNVVIERMLSKGVKRGRREGQDDGCMRAVEWDGVGRKKRLDRL